MSARALFDLDIEKAIGSQIVENGITSSNDPALGLFRLADIGYTRDKNFWKGTFTGARLTPSNPPGDVFGALEYSGSFCYRDSSNSGGSNDIAGIRIILNLPDNSKIITVSQ